MPGEITAGFKFGEAVAKLWTEWLKSSDRRRLRACIESAEKYIQVNEESGNFEGIKPEYKVKLLKHYSKRFWAYNQ